MTVQGWYEIKTNEKGVLSLSIGNYTIAYPAAHGLTIIKSLTFDISTAKSTGWKSSSNREAIMSAHCQK